MQGGRYPHIIRAVLARPWAIDSESLAWAAICDVLALRAAGEMLSEAEIQARIDAAANGPRNGGGRSGDIARIPLYGVISPRANLLSRTSGGTTAEEFGALFSAAMADPEVGGIVIDVDSPGGQIDGIDEVATLIRESRGSKPIVALAYHTMGSAAFWIGAQADELVVTPSGAVGSVGVLYAHEDISEAQEKLGVKTTLISAGKYKTERSPFAPLSDEAKAVIQSEADFEYGRFVRAVAKGRGVSAETVRTGFGEGRMVRAAKAVEAGMADRVDTLDGVRARLARGQVQSRALAPASAAVLADYGTAAAAAGAEVAALIAEAVGGTDTTSDPPPIEPPARVPGRRDQVALRMAALERGYPISQ